MTLETLFEIICSRRDHPIPGSYTLALLEAGEDEILKKIGEETIELIIAAKGQGERRLIEESADLLYHLLVLLAMKKIPPERVMGELDARHAEKKAR